MSNYLSYGGILSSDYGIRILDVNDQDKPQRDYTSVSIPGRKRDLHYDNGRYENIDRVYKCVVYSGSQKTAEAAFDDFTAALMRPAGYQRIEDSIHPEYYKVGEFKGGTEPEFAAGTGKSVATFELTFDCDARKYLKTGETQLTLAAGTNTIAGQGTEDAYPVFELTGNGYIEISGRRITVANSPGTMIIDCELGDAYSKAAHTNYNQYITVTGDGEFPVLTPGSNSIYVSGFTSRKMTARWART